MLLPENAFDFATIAAFNALGGVEHVYVLKLEGDGGLLLRHTGPIRDNLDPFNERTDGEIWDALGHAKLKDVIEELPGQLAFNVRVPLFGVSYVSIEDPSV